MTGGVLILFMEFLLQLVRAKGVAAVHFDWSLSTLTLLRRNTRRLMLLFVPITIVMLLVSVHAAPEIRDGLGRISLIVFCLAIAWIASRLWRLSRLSLAETDGDNWLWYIVYLWYPALMLIALATIGLSLLGYHYTASQLLRLTMQSIVLITMATLVHATLERAFSVFERRMALARAREARQAEPGFGHANDRSPGGRTRRRRHSGSLAELRNRPSHDQPANARTAPPARPGRHCLCHGFDLARPVAGGAHA
jgi:small-conductance mechanosensitive channel